jgi:uncharacterized protein YjbI with pentapeptide repeats
MAIGWSTELTPLLKANGASFPEGQPKEWSVVDWAQLLRQATGPSDQDTRHAMSAELTELALRETGKGLNLVGVDLSGLDLSFTDLRSTNLTRANISSTNFRGANLTGATIVCPLAERAMLVDANLGGFYAHALAIQNGYLGGVDLSNAVDVTGALFHGVDLTGACLSGANLSGSLFYQCVLKGADLSGATLTGTSFTECDLCEASFAGAHLEDAVLTKVECEGIDFSGSYGAGLVIQHVRNTEGGRFTGAQLPSLRLRHVHLRNVDAKGLEAERLDFTLSSLMRCDFDWSALSDAHFVDVSGEHNSFRSSHVCGATFVRCQLRRSAFNGAKGENLHIVDSSFRYGDFGEHELEDGTAPFTGRCLNARDSDFHGANFRNAYLYRAFFTGDPPVTMRLDDCAFDSANLIQAYVTASLQRTTLSGIKGAYMRLNQSDLTDAVLTNADLFEASLVKTNLTDADLEGVIAPVWIDRCPGIESAKLDEELRDWSRALVGVLKGRRRGST